MKLHRLLVLGAALGTASQLASAATAPIDAVPPAAEILKGIKPGHPRLLVSAEDLARLKSQVKTNPVLRGWQKEIQTSVGEILKAAPSEYVIPDGKRLLETSRRVMQRVYVLAWMYQMESDAKYAQRAWVELDAAGKFRDWNPKHFLDTAEMTHAFAIAYDWLYAYWTPQQREFLRQAILTKGLQPAAKSYQAGTLSGWARVENNWNQVCNGGIGMGALALAETDPQVAGEILNGVVRSLPVAMKHYAPDGAWNEGPGYWNYATIYNSVILAAMDTALGRDFGLSKIPGFDQTALYPIYITSPIERTFNYADGGDRGYSAAQLFWLSGKFNLPVAAWRQGQRTRGTPLDIVWYHPNQQSPKQAGLPLNKYFREAEVVTLRGDWTDEKTGFVGFKAGDNRANHGHLDIGSFVFDSDGVRWASDLGADNYNLPAFFGTSRWTYYLNRAEAHNTLVLNPAQAPDQVPSAKALITRFEGQGNRPFAIGDLTPAYAGQATQVRRGVALVGGRSLLVQDEIVAAKPAEAWWFMNTAAQIKIDPSGRSATLTIDGRELQATILGSAQGKFQTMAARPLPGSPNPDGQKSNSRYQKLAVKLTGVTDTTLAVFLSPKSAGPVSPGALVPLQSWGK